MIHRLSALIDELEAMRSMIYEENAEALSTHLEEATSAYGAWIARRKKGNWEAADQKPLPIPKISLTDRLFGTGDYHLKRDK